MKVILVSHGSFSKGLFETMEMVLGEQQNLSYVGLYPHQGVDILKENIEKEFTKADEGEEILVLTDLFYGSPFNAVVQLMNSYDVYHLTGINVPLLMEILLIDVYKRQVVDSFMVSRLQQLLDFNLIRRISTIFQCRAQIGFT